MNKCKMIKNRAALEAFFESGNYSTKIFDALLPPTELTRGEATISKTYNRCNKLCKVTITTKYRDIIDPTKVYTRIAHYCVCGIVVAYFEGVRVFKGKWSSSSSSQLIVCGRSSYSLLNGCLKVVIDKNSSIDPLYTQNLYLKENGVYVKKFVENMTKLLL